MRKRFRVNPFDLLGQEELWPIPVTVRGNATPRLEIAWSSFHQNFWSGIPVFFQRTRLPKGAPAAEVFRDCRVERRSPRRALVFAAAMHVSLFFLPWSALPAASRKFSAFENTQLTWSGPIEDLPLLHSPRETPRSRAKTEPAKPSVADSSEAFHPRQRIFTDPSRPTHPRQTLVNPAAPPDAPKFLPEMPNIVQLAPASAPARPRMEISEQTLAKLRPKTAKKSLNAEAPPTDAPNLEQRPADFSIAASADSPTKPKVPIDVGSAPRVASRNKASDAPAPELAASSPAAGNSASTLIALSSSPAPPAPVIPVPQGNLAARVAISPEGKPNAPGNGSPGSANVASNGNSASGAGNSSLGIGISGGSPKPNAGVSGLGGSLRFPAPKSQMSLKQLDPNVSIEDVPERTGPPNFAALPPGAPPEQLLNSRRVYSLNVNMPNLNSATGSWIIHFSELHLSGAGPRTGAVSAPVPLHKVDPKYPQDAILEHVEGEVILYGVIRKNGTVDSIQLVRGTDERLDANAIHAFGQWKFEPASREGQPVDLEAIVHIPFHAPERQ